MVQYKRCGKEGCWVSTGVCGRITHGKGRVDFYGYFSVGCYQCARVGEVEQPEFGQRWPLPIGKDLGNSPEFVNNL